jgi:hypothetical protein
VADVAAVEAVVVEGAGGGEGTAGAGSFGTVGSGAGTDGTGGTGGTVVTVGTVGTGTGNWASAPLEESAPRPIRVRRAAANLMPTQLAGGQKSFAVRRKAGQSR